MVIFSSSTANEQEWALAHTHSVLLQNFNHKFFVAKYFEFISAACFCQLFFFVPNSNTKLNCFSGMLRVKKVYH